MSFERAESSKVLSGEHSSLSASVQSYSPADFRAAHAAKEQEMKVAGGKYRRPYIINGDGTIEIGGDRHTPVDTWKAPDRPADIPVKPVYPVPPAPKPQPVPEA